MKNPLSYLRDIYNLKDNYCVHNKNFFLDKAYSLGKDNDGNNSNSSLVDKSYANDNQNSDKHESPDYS